MKRLFNRLDASPAIAHLLARISSTLAVYRGLPMLTGVVLVLLSCLLTAIFLPLIVSSSSVNDLWLLLCLPAGLLHLGIVAGFIGGLMSEPLGRGYRE